MADQMATQVGVFVSHHHSADEDDFTARLVADLEAAGADVWVDDARITSDDFITKINAGLAGRQWLVLVMTPDALRSPWVQAEVNAALNQVRKGRMLGVIPVVARPCADGEIPPLLDTLHRYDATSDYAPARDGLLRAIGLAAPLAAAQPPAPAASGVSARLATLGYRSVDQNGSRFMLPPLLTIPAGKFRLGSDQRRDKLARDDELRRVVVNLPAFQIARFPVTVAEYACFVGPNHAPPPNWAEQRTQLDHPVVQVCWYDAYDYAAWLAERTGQPWRLPTEAEWEKAARCDPRDPLGASSERRYPWGDSEDLSRCDNNSNYLVRGVTPIGWYGPDTPDPGMGWQSGASPCGVEEMSGSVWEWTSSLYAHDYSKATQPVSRTYNSTEQRSLRGGSWGRNMYGVRAATRYHGLVILQNEDIGFRLMRATSS
ncbi:MAG TPA: SUMF1/EgtB/PvdO family nonheme iron enzyme [Ktedonobacterales bacterium]